MAQTGFTPIQLYSSSTTGNTPAAADLLNSSGGSELAINIFDGKLFYKDSSGNVQVIGWKVVPVSAGGTGQTSYTDGQLLIGNSTGNTLAKSTLTAGTGISITNGAGAITISATGGTGTVTSVSGTAPISVATGTTTPVISISQSGVATDGYLSSTDWNTFNGKAPATTGTAILYGNGTGGFSSVTIGTGVTFAAGTLSATGSGGDVVGPASSTDNAIARFDLATGKLLQNSVVIVGDTGSITGVNALTAESLVVNNNVTLGSSNADTLEVNSRITTDLEPNANNAKDIGTSGRNWRDGFFGRNLDTVNLSVTGTTSFDGSQGTSGQVLTSAGTGVTPTWTTPTTGTVTSVAALTLGTTGTDLSSTVANGTTTPVITLNVPTASAANRGALSSTDWSTFNGKQAALVSGTNIKTVGGVSLLGSGDVGTIGTGYGGTGLTSFTSAGVVYASSTSALATGTNLTFDGTNLFAAGVISTNQSLNFTGSGSAPSAGYGIRLKSGLGTQVVSSYRIGISVNGGTSDSVTFFDSGGVSIGNTTDPGAGALSVTGNVIQGTAAKGYNFTANTPAAGMTSQLLNWYEEGTFTPTIIGTTTAGTGTYSIQSGRYTRIGRTISIQLQLAWSAHTGTGNMKVAGLPFTSNSTLPSQMSIGAFNLTLTALYFPLARQEQSTTQINLLQSPTGGGAWVGVPIDTSVDALEISGTYTV